MTGSRWVDVYRFEDQADGTTVSLEQLTYDGEIGTIPGALILNVEPVETPGAWASLPYAALRELRDVLTEWIDRGEAAHG